MMEGIEWVETRCSRLLVSRRLGILDRLTGETAGGGSSRPCEADGNLSPVFEIFHLLHRVREDINYLTRCRK